MVEIMLGTMLETMEGIIPPPLEDGVELGGEE